MQIPSFVCSGTMVIELREFNDKKKKEEEEEEEKEHHGQNAKIKFCYNLAKKW